MPFFARSMNDEIPRALGAIADFCDTVAVDQVRLLQCDTGVTADDLVAPMDLARYEITGYGGSDLSPAMVRLSEDAQVRAVAIITDGVNGLLFDPHAPGSLRPALQRLIADPALRATLGAAARATIREHHTWDHNAQAVLRAVPQT